MKDRVGLSSDLLSWQSRIFALLWGAYASYYLCRANFAVAQPEILKEFPEWSAAQIGSIPSAFAIAYAAGQIVNGALAHRFGTRRMMTAALLIASTTNLLFAFANSFATMQVLWAINGWGQSAGWALMVQTLTDWNSSTRRGTWIGRLSTSYQAGHILSWLLAGTLVDWIGWRAAFLVPGLLLLPWTVAFFALLRDVPADAGFGPVRDDVPVESGAAPIGALDTVSLWQILKQTLGHRVIWILGVAFFVMNAVRYTFINWSVHYMADYHGRSIKGSVVAAIVIPLAGALGALSAGWASDVIFGKRRAPVCVLMLLGATVTCSGMAMLSPGEWIAATVLLGIAGFMVYGPDVLIAGAATVDFSHPRAASIATGFTMCLGGFGTVFSGVGIGHIVDVGQGNWTAIFEVLAGFTLVPALLLTLLWNTKPK